METIENNFISFEGHYQINENEIFFQKKIIFENDSFFRKH